MMKPMIGAIMFVSMALSFAPRPSLADSKAEEPPTPVNDPIYYEFSSLDHWPYYWEEFNDYGDITPMEKVFEQMDEYGIRVGHYIFEDFVVGGINLAEYEMSHPPFLLYEDFDIGSYVLDGPVKFTWKELLMIRNKLERPSLSWYVDKVARKRWFAEEDIYPQPEVYYVQYKDELSATGSKEDIHKTILANLPKKHGFCAKPTHMSMTMGNWLVDIVPGVKDFQPGFTKQAQRLAAVDSQGNFYDPSKCADSLAEGLSRVAMPIESWALKNVKPGIVIEELFSSHEDRTLPPHEFCMFVIWGKFYVGQWNQVGDDRYLSGFFHKDESPSLGCSYDELPDWVPWQEMVHIAESLSEHKDMFRVDMFVGVPRYSDEDADLRIVVNESEIHPTTMFCNPFVADEMARLWLAGYKIGNYEVIPNDEVPEDFVRNQVPKAAAEAGSADTNSNEEL